MCRVGRKDPHIHENASYTTASQILFFIIYWYVYDSITIRTSRNNKKNRHPSV